MCCCLSHCHSRESWAWVHVERISQTALRCSFKRIFAPKSSLWSHLRINKYFSKVRPNTKDPWFEKFLGVSKRKFPREKKAHEDIKICLTKGNIRVNGCLNLIGLLQQTITWYKIRHAGGQAHHYSRTGTLKQRQVKLDWFRSLCFNIPVRE